MERFIIIETIFGEEFKIGLLSNRFGPTTMYTLLADTYYLGDIITVARNNKFESYELAVKAIEELNKGDEQWVDI